jgi:hypothetical protein
MKLRSGRKYTNYSLYWWYPFIKQRHKHSTMCYCSNMKSLKFWIDFENNNYMMYKKVKNKN